MSGRLMPEAKRFVFNGRGKKTFVFTGKLTLKLTFAVNLVPGPKKGFWKRFVSLK